MRSTWHTRPVISLPIPTERLRLRLPTEADAAVIAAYRNDPDVARYQDWPLPYTADDALAGIRRQAHLSGPSMGSAMNVVIEHDGSVVGDVYVQIGDELAGAAVASIGYTLATAHHGRGFASEAAAAMVDALFACTPVHRIAATLDPENQPSMRLLEQLGFRFEGLTRRSEPIRGAWLDDMRFALMRDDRAEWLTRPRTCSLVELVEVTHDNLAAVCALETHRFQRRFVSPMDRSLAQALVPPEVAPGHLAIPWYRAIVADGEVVGFAMVSDVSEAEPHPFLWRLLVDRRHQRRGVGVRAVTAVAQHFHRLGHTSLMVSWVEGLGGPRRFYERLGFVPTGDLDGDEVIARLEL